MTAGSSGRDCSWRAGRLLGGQAEIRKQEHNLADNLEPTIKLCRQGVPVSASLAEVLRSKGPNFTRNYNTTDPGISELFVNPETGDVCQEGDLSTNPALTDTLQVLAEEGDQGAHSFYNGAIAEKLLKDIKHSGKTFLSLIFPTYLSHQAGSSQPRTWPPTRWSGSPPSRPS